MAGRRLCLPAGQHQQGLRNRQHHGPTHGAAEGTGGMAYLTKYMRIVLATVRYVHASVMSLQ